MDPREFTRAPTISGIDTQGDRLSIDYSENLINVLVFFDPVSCHSLEAIEAIQLLSLQYEKLSVCFWFIMEPRPSCMYKSEIAQRTLNRLGLFSKAIYDVNNQIGLNFGLVDVPTVLIVDSNSFIRLKFEGDIAFREVERAIQARLAVSGYKVELPELGEADIDLPHLHSTSVMKQLGYGANDYVLNSMVVPEANQEFILPNLYFSHAVYPLGDWYVGRDYMEGKNGSTVYVSCGSEESVYLFAGSEEGALLRIHTSIGSHHRLVFGREVENRDGLISLKVSEFRPYEVLSCAGDSMISLQVMDGSLKLYTVEFCPLNQLVAINH